MNTRNSITSQDEKLVNMQMSIGYKSGLQKQLKMVYMTITNNCCPIQRVIRGLSRMKGNFHVRFLEEGEGAISPSYSAMTRIHTDFVSVKIHQIRVIRVPRLGKSASSR